MGAIQFPLTSDNQSAPNQVAPQEATKLPSGAAGPSNVLEPDVVTLSASFPPAQAVANVAQFPPPSQPAAQAIAQHIAVAAFPPPVDTANLNSGATLGTIEQQQALQQLSETLLELGINPQNISLENRLSLLPAANDPPALLNLVHALSVIDPQWSAESSNNISNPAQPAAAPAQAPAQLPLQTQPRSQAQALVQPQTSASTAGSGFESISQAAARELNLAALQNPPQLDANSGAALTGNHALQFQALQLAFQAAEYSPGAPAGGEASGTSTSQQASSLNVLA